MNYESFLASIVNYSEDAIYGETLDGTILSWNAAAEKMYEYSAEEAKGQSVMMIIPPECKEELAELVEKIKRKEHIERHETFRMNKSGKRFPVSQSTSPIINDAGEVVGIAVIARDITERKRAEEALREAEEKFRVLLTQIPGVGYKGYADSSIDFFDDKIETMTGYKKEDFDSRKLRWCELMPKEDFESAKKIFVQALKTNQHYVREYRIRNKEGKMLWIQERSQIICDQEGKIDHVSGIMFDITERKQVEAELAIKTKALSRQAREIIDISTPVIQVWEGMVATPLIGMLDSHRTQNFMEILLERIVETGSSIALVDITGVPTVDTETARHLIETITAVRLLGAEVILTGVRPPIARTLVHLGIDLSGIITRSSLAAGLSMALDMLNLKITSREQ